MPAKRKKAIDSSSESESVSSAGSGSDYEERPRTKKTNRKKPAPKRPQKRLKGGKTIVQNPVIAAVPSELLLEFVVYFPPMELPYDAGLALLPKIQPGYFDREDALRALSQTCRHFRNVYLPLLWERVEAVSPGKRDYFLGAEKGRSKERILLWRSRGLSQRPDLGAYVRIFKTAILFGKSLRGKKTDLDHLMLALRHLPNLDYLEITTCPAKESTSKSMDIAVSGQSFPSIRKLKFPAKYYPIISCAPNVREISVSTHWHAGRTSDRQMFKLIKEKDIEAFDADAASEDIVKAMPRLRRLTVRGGLHSTCAQKYSALKRLQAIHIVTHETGAKLQSSIANAKKILRASKSAEKKKLTVAGFKNIGYGMCGQSVDLMNGSIEEITID